MERLLADASKLSGIEYNIDNLSDVYEAIHVIQEDLDITGTTAKEAASTFSGSFASMKAAVANLMGNMAIGAPINKELNALSESVKTFVVGNLLPMIGDVVSQLPNILANIPGMLADLLPDVLAGGVDIVDSLAHGIIDNLPVFLDGVGQLFKSIPQAIMGIDWGGMASSLLEALSGAMYNIWDSVTELFKVEFGIDLPDWDTVVKSISDLWENVKAGITEFFKAAFDIITDDDKTITEKISALWELVKGSIGDLFKATFDVIVPAFGTIISKISNWWGENVWPGIQDFFKATFGIDLPDWSTIVEEIKALWESIKTGIASLFSILFNIDLPSSGDIAADIETLWNSVWEGISDFFKTTFGIEIPSWEDVKASVEAFWNEFKEGISGFFEIVFSVAMPLASGIVSAVGSLWEEVKKGISSFFSWVFSIKPPDLDEVIAGLKEFWNSVVTGIGDFFTLKWILGNPKDSEVYDEFSGAGKSFEIADDKVNIDSDKIQKALNDANLTLADIDTSSLDTALMSVSTCIAGMQQAFDNAKFTLPSVKTAALLIAKQAVTSAVSSMKSTMRFVWSLPDLHGHLPVISVNMRTASSSDGKTNVSYPDLSVSGFKWFAKGGIFNSPTVIGIGDSKGPEAAVPLDEMWKRMRHEFDAHSTGAQVTNYITIDGAENPEEFADRLVRQLKLDLRTA